jgi:hypothetical protein
MRSLVVLGPFFIVLTAACTSGLSSYKAPDGSAGGTGGLAVSSSSSWPGGTTSSAGGATSIIGGMPGLFGGTASSASHTGGIPSIAGNTGTGRASSTGGIPSSGGTSSTGGIPSTGGILPLGGTSSAGGTGGGGTSASSIPLVGACANLTCLNPLSNLMAACDTSTAQTCTQQTTMVPSMVENSCYSNGVKTQTVMNSDLSSITAIYKNDSSVCYSMDIGGISSGVTTVVVKDSAGTTVATITADSTGADTVTCPGGTPTVVDASCGSVGATSSASPTCTTGTCVF